MNERHDHVEQELRASLHRGADTLPYAPDMTTGAIDRARRIRRGRRTWAGAAVLAVVAVAVPVGLQAADSPRAGEPPAPPATQEIEGPTQVDLDLATMSEGPAPGMPFAQNGVGFLAGDAGTVDFQGLDWAGYDAWGDTAVVTESYDAGGALYRYDPTADMQTRDVLVEVDTDGVLTSADHRWLAYVDAGEGDAPGTITVSDAQTGQSNTVGIGGYAADLLAVVDGTVYFRSGDRDPPLRSWSDADGFRYHPYDASMVSDDGSLTSTVTKHTDLDSCHALVELASDEVRWRTCDWTPEAVSPDGRWVYATPAYADGYGPVEVAVLDAETGEVVRTVSFGTGEDVGFFRDAAWETDDALLLQVEAAGQAALVRVTVATGEATTATPPVPYAGLDDPDPAPPPYLLG